MTVPKVIASGETITIPAGRVAILPNLVIDGVLNIENDGEVFIPSGSTFGDLDAQIALKADTSYVSTQLWLKANTADLKEIGVGQTWQNVTASRVLGITYTNSTGKPIQLGVTINNTSGNNLYINNVQATTHNSTAYTTDYNQIIPDGSTYKIVGGLNTSWFELR